MSDVSNSADRGSHPDAVRIAAYAEGRLTGEARSAMEAHLADCDACRAETTDVALLLRDLVGARRRRIGIPVAVAAAAAAVLLIVGPFGGPTEEEGDRLRPGVAADREGVPSIDVVLPAGAAVIPADSARFLWRSAESEARYRFTLTDETGAVVWEEGLGDTTLVLPPEVTLERGATYLWFIDASLADGQVATTGVRELRIR